MVTVTKRLWQAVLQQLFADLKNQKNKKDAELLPPSRPSVFYWKITVILSSSATLPDCTPSPSKADTHRYLLSKP